MPRPRDIVMTGITAEERREAVIARAVQVHQPYRAWKDLYHKGQWLIVYTSPRDMSRRKVMDSIVDRETAKDLVSLLEREWAEGYIAGQE